MRVLYIDEYIIINFAANYLALLGAAVICGVYASRIRMAIGALIGAVYASAAVILGQTDVIIIKLLVSAAMAFAAFYPCKSFVKIYAVFMLVSAVMGGTIYGISAIFGNSRPRIDTWVLLIVFAVTYSALKGLLKNSGRILKGGIVETKVKIGNGSAHFNTLLDTGNSLRDPLTGKYVMVVEFKELCHIRAFEGIHTKNLERPVEVLQNNPNAGLRLIPFKAVGSEKGMLLGITPDSLTVGGEKRNDVVIALSPWGISDGGAYSALIGVN